MEDKGSPIQNQLDDLLGSGVYHVMLINERGRVDMITSKSKIPLSKERQEIFSLVLGYTDHYYKILMRSLAL